MNHSVVKDKEFSALSFFSLWEITNPKVFQETTICVYCARSQLVVRLNYHLLRIIREFVHILFSCRNGGQNG